MTATGVALRPARRGYRATQLVAVLLATATLILVFRLPGAVVLSLLLPLGAIALAGIHRPRRDSWALWLFLGLGIVSAGLAVWISPAEAAFINYATLTLIFAVFAVAILGTGGERTAAGAVIRAMYVAFGATMLIGVIEILGNFKLGLILYPMSDILRLTGRFNVSAFFPNYNDYAVVVTMFSLMTLIRLFLNWDSSLLTKLTRAGLFVLGSWLIYVGGSRGALAALLIGVVLVVLTVIRLVRPRLVTGAFLIPLGALAGAAGLMLWGSPTIQDNSTMTRGLIIDGSIGLSLRNPKTVFLGWGDLDNFQAAAAKAFPGQLMDPHNLILELFTWFGIPATIAFLVLWGYVCWRGLWRLDLRTGWTSLSAVVLFTLTPVLGVVPSSSLRYYYVFLLAACAIAALRPAATHDPSPERPTHVD